MARAAGVHLARVITFSESSNNYPGPIYYSALSEGKGAASAPTPDIQPGTQEVKVSVVVTYEIR